MSNPFSTLIYLFPFLYSSSLPLYQLWRTVAMGAVLGVKDWNERNSRYASALTDGSLDYMASCDMQFNPTMYDTGSNSKGSIMAYREAFGAEESSAAGTLHSIVGCARSDASKPMATLGGIDGIPQSSYWSTSDGLDDTGVYTYFSRTIPADSAVAKAAAELVKSYGHSYVGVAFVQDPYGEAWKDAFVKFCGEGENPVQVITSGFIGGDQDSVEASVDVFKAASVRVGFFVSFDEDFKIWSTKLEAEDMAGPGYIWVAGDGVSHSTITSAGTNIAHGMGKILSLGGVPGNTAFDKFASDWTGFDDDADLKAYAEDLWHDYVADAGHQENYDNGVAGYHAAGTDLSKISPTFFADNSPDDVATYAYDSVMSLGFASCKYIAAGGTFDADYSGPELFQHLTETTFSSITGTPVYLENGNRDPATGNYVLFNFQCASGSCTGYTGGKWTADGGWDYTAATGGSTTPDGKYMFSNGNTCNNEECNAPPDFLKPDEELNLLGGGLVTVGNMLVAINYAIALTFAVITFQKRKHKVIRASQPMFLYMVLMGCCISTSTIIFFGLDDGGDYDKADDVNCMFQPIFYSLGFVFSFAALFAKITRIAKIFGNRKLAKVTITWVDMMKPIVGLLLVDLIILILWMNDAEAALKWERVPKTVDSMGNVLESTGLCRSDSPWFYGGLILGLHFFVLIYGNYMCYKSRNAGTAFSESKYVFMAMVSNLQIMALGVPMLVMVYDNPVSNYFMRTGIVFMNDVGVMLLIFIPKFQLVFFGTEEQLNAATSTSTSSGTAQGTSQGTSDGD